MIKNKQTIKIICLDLVNNFSLLRDLNHGNVIIDNVSRSGIDLVNVILEELDK